jgi:uncharacterized protein
MKITGAYEFDAAAQKVWSTLMDPGVLSDCIPGCEGFNATGENQYQASVNVGIGPVRGRYNAKVSLRDLRPPQSYRLVIEGSGPAGFANGEATVTLTEQGGKTSVAVEGDAQIGGMAAMVGQRMVGSVAQGMLDRFFACLAQAAR